jgi:hypothetical protein
MPATYEPISTTTLGSNANSVTLSSIPSTYTDLLLVVNFGQNVADDMRMQFNSDTGSNYSTTALVGNGTTASSTRYTSVTGVNPRVAANPPTSIGAIWKESIQNYSNTTTFKTTLGRLDYAVGEAETHVGLWRSTSAITSITLSCFVNNFITGSTFTLYGIKAA